jgi:hypothetical protein
MTLNPTPLEQVRLVVMALAEGPGLSPASPRTLATGTSRRRLANTPCFPDPALFYGRLIKARSGRKLKFVSPIIRLGERAGLFQLSGTFKRHCSKGHQRNGQGQRRG